ncbi:MAG TPA: FAD-binding oxidoreductase [Woeseiaceae bacterium]|nr:FAD-binding oxidoreductase [Woeseiaceae bacterium]
MKADVCVIGAGVVGIASALELQARGADVVLVDRDHFGLQTSFGNAGVLSASTVLNVNNPGLWRSLPGLILGTAPYFRYDLTHAISRLPWLLKFLHRGSKRYTLATAKSLNKLQTLSLARHRQLISEANADSLYQARGWLKVFRDERGFDSSRLERRLLEELDIPFQQLLANELAEIEPGLHPIYHSGLLLSTTCSVSDPYLLCKAYFELFMNRGGRFELFDVASVVKKNGGYSITSGDVQMKLCSDNIVIACGPWSVDVCRLLGYKIPMAWERGYHVNVESPSTRLNRPVCDVQRGFVMAPQGETTRITSGVEFAYRDAPPNYSQIYQAYRNAETAAPIGKMTDEVPWLGSRPTLPDGLPAIGAAPRHSGIWFNFGHQHIGMSTSAGSASILADAIEGKSLGTMSREFLPQRFRI